MGALKKVTDTYLSLGGFKKKPEVKAPSENAEPGYYDRVDSDVSKMQKQNLADPKKAKMLKSMNERIQRTNRKLAGE